MYPKDQIKYATSVITYAKAQIKDAEIKDAGSVIRYRKAQIKYIK